MIIQLGSQKGGTGKSTIAVNLAAEFVRLGHDVVLLDADPQMTASQWAERRESQKKVEHVHCIQKNGNIRQTLLELDNRHDYTIVDTAGHDSRELRTAMTASDLLIIPFKPSQADLDTLPNLEEIIQQAKDFNPNLKPLALLNMSPTNPMTTEITDARILLSDFGSINLLNTIVRDRKVFRDCMSEGLGVVEMANAKAKGEIQVLVMKILENAFNISNKVVQ